jgi:hypothetical protein
VFKASRRKQKARNKLAGTRGINGQCATGNVSCSVNSEWEASSTFIRNIDT